MYIYWRVQQDLNEIANTIVFHHPNLIWAFKKWCKKNAIPVESQTDLFALKRSAGPRYTAHIFQPVLEPPPQDHAYTLPVEKIYIELPPPAAGDNEPDTNRIINALRQQHNERRLVMDLELIRSLPDILRQADFKVTVTLLRPIQEGRKSHIIDVTPGDTTMRHFTLAVDIGTTTVQSRLIDSIILP